MLFNVMEYGFEPISVEANPVLRNSNFMESIDLPPSERQANV